MLGGSLAAALYPVSAAGKRGSIQAYSQFRGPFSLKKLDHPGGGRYSRDSAGCGCAPRRLPGVAHRHPLLLSAIHVERHPRGRERGARPRHRPDRRAASRSGRRLGAVQQDAPDRPIYLDHNATTPVAGPVLEAMYPFLESEFGNPSSSHRYGSDPTRRSSGAGPGSPPRWVRAFGVDHRVHGRWKRVRQPGDHGDRARRDAGSGRQTPRPHRHDRH